MQAAIYEDVGDLGPRLDSESIMGPALATCRSMETEPFPPPLSRSHTHTTTIDEGAMMVIARHFRGMRGSCILVLQ